MWWLVGVAMAVELDVHSVENFLRAMEMADAGVPLKLALRRQYLSPESDAQRAFLRYANARSARRLARCVERHPELYGQIEHRLRDVQGAHGSIIQALDAITELFPSLLVPTVYVHVGCFNSGGTATRHGLHVGLEHFTRPEPFPERYRNTWFDVALHEPDVFPRMVIHELAHFQQPDQAPTLLHMALIEGGADFVAHLFAGGVVTPNHDFGRAHEADIWDVFSAQMQDKPMAGTWFYTETGTDWPRDLGYFVGFRIVEAYWEQADDKAQALSDLFALEDVELILEQSGYAQRFAAP
ncbi:MAG: DUF2268 domain-containing putative Zn-dependent protease [Myxococcota bacterium]